MGETGWDLGHPALCDLGQAGPHSKLLLLLMGFRSMTQKREVQGLEWGLRMMCAGIFFHSLGRDLRICNSVVGKMGLNLPIFAYVCNHFHKASCAPSPTEATPKSFLFGAGEHVGGWI